MTTRTAARPYRFLTLLTFFLSTGASFAQGQDVVQESPMLAAVADPGPVVVGLALIGLAAFFRPR